MTTYIWDQKGLPHKGWACESVEELDEATHTCEMCNKPNIRFVHNMRHPDGHTVAVGCECAGHLTDDYETQRELNKQAHSRSARHSRDLKRLNKIKTEWFNKPWLEFDQASGIKRTDHIEALWYNPKQGGWRYRYWINFNGKEILKGSTMFEHDARNKIEQFVKEQL